MRVFQISNEGQVTSMSYLTIFNSCYEHQLIRYTEVY